MKHYFLLGLVMALGLQSCSTTRAVRDQRGMIDGSWTLTDLSYENNQGAFQATLFNDADAICFEGSRWQFLSNNSTGHYTITPGSLCTGGDRYIRWSVIERPESYNSQLQFKFTDAKFKDIGSGTGYRLTIESLTASEMRLKSNVQVNGEPLSIIYQFSKN